MIFSYRKKERRQELLAEPFPEEWHTHLRNNVLLYRLLSDVEQGKLRDALRIFIAEKFWEGCGGLTITDEIKVTIAAQASLLIQGFDDYYFDEVQSILVYPGGYLVSDSYADKDRVHHLTGIAHRKGPVVLSWWDSLWDGRRLGQSNLVIHEFAHKLAELNDPVAGAPPIEDPDLEIRWEKVMTVEYERLVDDAQYGRPTLLDAYGASNRDEFFSVATECFFLQPVALLRRHRELYQVLAEWYRQDPAERRTRVESEVVETEDAESEYDRHVIAECSVAIRLHPEQVDAYRSRAEFYCRQAAFDRALEDYSTAIRLAPDDVEIYCDRGAVYRAKGRLDQALADFSQALQLSPDYPRAYCERAAAHTDNGDLDAALADLNKAIRLDPKDDGAHNQRGLVYADKGEYDKAIRDFSRAIRLFPHSPDVYANRAFAYLSKQEYDQAIDDCARALEIDPRLPEAYSHRGVAHFHKGEHDKAIDACSAAIRIDPHYAEAYRARALAYTAIGAEENARQDYAEAEKLEMPQ